MVQGDVYFKQIIVIDQITPEGERWLVASDKIKTILQIFPGPREAQIENHISYTALGTYGYHAKQCADELTEIAEKRSSEGLHQPLRNKAFLATLFALAHAAEEGMEDEAPMATVVRARRIMRDNDPTASDTEKDSTQDLLVREVVLQGFLEATPDSQVELLATAQFILYRYRIIHIARLAFKAYDQEKIVVMPQIEELGDPMEQRAKFFQFLMNNRTPDEQLASLERMISQLDANADVSKLAEYVVEQVPETGTIVRRKKVTEPPVIRTEPHIKFKEEPSFFTEVIEWIDDIIGSNPFILSVFEHLAGQDKVKLVRQALETLRAIDAAARANGPIIDKIVIPAELREFITNIKDTVVLLARRKGKEAGLPEWIDTLFYSDTLT